MPEKNLLLDPFVFFDYLCFHVRIVFWCERKSCVSFVFGLFFILRVYEVRD